VASAASWAREVRSSLAKTWARCVCTVQAYQVGADHPVLQHQAQLGAPVPAVGQHRVGRGGLAAGLQDQGTRPQRPLRAVAGGGPGVLAGGLPSPPDVVALKPCSRIPPRVARLIWPHELHKLHELYKLHESREPHGRSGPARARIVTHGGTRSQMRRSRAAGSSGSSPHALRAAGPRASLAHDERSAGRDCGCGSGRGANAASQRAAGRAR
jgi:hypothetical protein